MGNLIFGPWPPVVHANLGKVQIAREIGVSTKTVERYMKAGMPHERDRRGFAQFNLQKCLDWLDSRDERTG